MTAEARSVVVRLTMEAAQYIAQAQAVGTLTAGAMTKAEAATARQTRAINHLGSTAGKAGLVAAASLGAMAKAAVDFESQFAGVEKTVDGTAGQLADLEAELRRLATTMPATHQEILGVAEAAGQLGVAREDISDFTETMVQLGETTNLTAEGAATDIAQMANVMGTAPAEVERLGAALVALGNDGASTEAQILGMAQRIAGAGALIGLTEADILGIANAASSMGIEVEAGGTAISRVFTEMAKATSQGGKDLRSFAGVAGVSAKEFAQAFEDDPARAFASFTAGLDRINESGGDVFSVLDDLGLSDARVSRALLSMASSGDLLTDSLDLGASAWEENSALANEYGKRLDTASSDARIAWNKIKDAGIEAGTALLPVVSEIAGVVGDMAAAFGALPDPVQGAVTKLLAITAIFGGGLWFTAKVIGGIRDAKAALGDLGITAGNTGTSLGSMTRSTAGILALGGAVTILGNKLAEATGTKIPVSELNRELDSLAMGGNDKLFEQIGEDMQTMGDRAGHATEFLKEGVTVLGLFGGTPLDNAQNNIKNIDAALATMVEGGNADRAAEIFEEIVAAADEQGVSLETVRDRMDQYLLAVDNLNASTPGFVDNMFAMGLAAAVAADDTEDLADGIDDATDSVYNFSNALENLEGWLGRREAARAYADSLKDLTRGLKNGFTRKDAENIDAVGRSIGQMAQKMKEGPREDFLRGEIKNLRELASNSGPKASAEIQELIRQLGKLLPPKPIEPVVLKGPAIDAINYIQNALNGIEDETVWVNIQRRNLGDSGIGPGRSDATLTPAGGGHVRGPGTWTSDSIPARLSDNEYVMKAAAVDKYGVAMMHDINAMRFADGGSPRYGIGDAASATRRGSSGRTAAELLAIAEALQSVRDLRRQLAADGKDKLEGHKRKIAELQLRVAEQEYRVAKKADAREDREKARDEMRETRDKLQGIRSDLRSVGQGFSLDSLVPGKPLTVAQGTAAELRQFRADIVAAGGKWTKSMTRWAADLIETAGELDRVNAQLAAETAQRDQLVARLNDEQQALDQLTSTMESFSDQVASNFLNDPFNQAGSSTASPELDAARAELAAIRASATGDSAEAAARAEQLIHQIAQLGGSGSGGGLAAFDATVAANTKASRDMARALQTLQDKGLDTTGPLGALYAQLAASGDLLTAQELAALTIGEIDARERAFAESQNEAAATAALATQAIYGQDQAQLVAAVQSTTAAIATSDATMARLTTAAENIGTDVRDGAKDAMLLLQPQFAAIARALDRLPEELLAAAKKART